MFKHVKRNGKEVDAMMMENLVRGDTFMFPNGVEHYQISVKWKGQEQGPEWYYNQINNGSLRKVKYDCPVVPLDIEYTARIRKPK